MVKVVERKKKEKRGQLPLSDLGDPPLEEKQQRKRTRRDSVPAPLRRSRCLKPNPDADKIHHGKPEKRVRIHPKKEEKQVLNYDICPDITAEECAFYEEHILKKSDGSFVPSMHGVMAFRRALRLPPYVERKKKEKRGQPPLSDLGDPPLEEKQQRTRRASVPAPLRRSLRLNPNPDADKIRHGEPEKRVRIHPKKEEKQVSRCCRSDFYNDMRNWHRMTAEEYFFYNEHVLKSDGFDIPSMRGVIACGLIQPCYINTLVEARRFILYSNLAIDEYNTWIHTHKLKFRKVLKAMAQPCDVIRNYITFVAKEAVAGGQTKTYQAVVRNGVEDDDNTVLSFRECEQEEGSGIRGKEWIWKGHAHI